MSDSDVIQNVLPLQVLLL